MAKRQIRIYRPFDKEGIERLAGSYGTFCLENNSIVLGTIISCKEDSILVKDSLSREYAVLFDDVKEIILEKEEIL